MRRTLFYLPHEIAGLPVFGFGWVLLIWVIICGVSLYGLARRGGRPRELLAQLPMLLLVAAAIVFLVPRIEEPIRDTLLVIPPVTATTGLPIRGYGVMLLLAVVSGVGLAVWRARAAGLTADVIMGLAFHMVVGGIIGARLFFVIQYWSLLRGDHWQQTLANVFSVDKGGLVVYGSLIGALVAFGWFCRRYRLPALPLADLIAPSLALGLALGRIGCLLNGCCFGGECNHAWAMRFPAESPPYLDQKGWGEFYGIRLGDDADGRVRLQHVHSDGPFGDALQADDRIVAINGQPVDSLSTARHLLERSGTDISLTLSSGRTVAASVDKLPDKTNPIHPTQIYSSINASLLCLLTLAVYPYRRKHGQVMALLLSGYAVTRFLLEMIRSDESEFVAQLTISQNVSLLVAVAMVALWCYVQCQPEITAPDPPRSPGNSTPLPAK